MLEKVSLFKTRRDFFHFLILLFTLFALSLSLEYYNYKELTKFDSQLVKATVLKQYEKTKVTKKGKTKSYHVLKLITQEGALFYTTASKNLPDLRDKELELEIWAGKISFYEYMTSFYAFSKILHIKEEPSLKTVLNRAIARQHTDENIALIYQALFTAKQLPYELQKKFSQLGISHLVAISGFHLGVLSAILFFLLKLPYKFLQNRYFPYRSYRVDSFVLIGGVLLAYLLFLDSPPSLLRAFGMLLIGFILHDRGIKVISMETLLLTVLVLLALSPRLFFALGFWLSVAGVFSIFLFLLYCKNLSNMQKFLLLPFWIYLFMVGYSLTLFGNFSLYHPLSILWTSLFTLFYPVALTLHILGVGHLLDPLLSALLTLPNPTVEVQLTQLWLIPLLLFSLVSIYKKWALYFLFVTSLLLLIDASLLLT